MEAADCVCFNCWLLNLGLRSYFSQVILCFLYKYTWNTGIVVVEGGEKSTK